MVERKEYLDQLWAWKDERQIKVVTGIRRCGKSVLLEQYQQRLLANGVAPEQIISINFENLDYEPLKDYMRLYNYPMFNTGGICVHAIDDAEDKVLASVNGENPEWCEMAEQPQEDGDEMESGFLFGSFFVAFSGVIRMGMD